MAHKKGQGSTKNGRDSNPQYRSVKLYEGETAQPGSIIVRQVGTPLKAGFMVRRGKDDTLYSITHGKVIVQGRLVHVSPTDPKEPRPFWLKESKSIAPAANKATREKKTVKGR